MLLNEINVFNDTNEVLPEGCNLKCWEKKEENYKIHIFSTIINSQSDLEKNWKGINSYIATYFQGLILDKSVERWNLYFFIFVNEKVSINTKYKIEQDKFSTRKIVIDEIPKDSNDEYIKNRIEEELFHFSIGHAQEYNETKIDEILNTNHNAVFNHIRINAKLRINDNELKSIIEELGNEQN
jgi:hypothetical protein